jgi:hypothetical protein
MKIIGGLKGACIEIISSEKGTCLEERNTHLHQEGREIINISTFNQKKQIVKFDGKFKFTHNPKKS